MTPLTDSAGRPLPEIETPDAERLRIYGDMMFLALRSARHARMPVADLRSYLEVPILTGQFRIFRFDGIPRGMFTWALLDTNAQEKLVTGRPLAPQDWNSGTALWIIDMIGPYRGVTRGMVRWIMQRGNFAKRDFHFRRVGAGNETRRIVHVDFDAPRLSRVFTEAGFLERLHGGHGG
ncbi:toxin-activating lysine-acyltransferase [Rhodosalinus halophilus]|nr:toxin-activating lysine-acyltransferase [Rhodosalinus halophilus]